MKRALIDALVCAVSRDPLTLVGDDAAEEVETAELVCSGGGELEGWFRESGLEDITIMHRHGHSWRGRERASAPAP